MSAVSEWVGRFERVGADERRAMVAAERIERGAEILRRVGWSDSAVREWREEHALSVPVDIDD